MTDAAAAYPVESEYSPVFYPSTSFYSANSTGEYYEYVPVMSSSAPAATPTWYTASPTWFVSAASATDSGGGIDPSPFVYYAVSNPPAETPPASSSADILYISPTTVAAANEYEYLTTQDQPRSSPSELTSPLSTGYTLGSSKATPNEESNEETGVFKIPSLTSSNSKMESKDEVVSGIVDENQCDKCGKIFRDRKHLKRHVKIHKSTRMYTCEFCGKTFNRSDNMKTHMRKHTGETPFQCTICLKKFKYQSGLINHHAVHRSDRPWVCEICGKSFKRKCSLQSHGLSCTSSPMAGGTSGDPATK